jgi:hypothetical protein
LLEWWGKTAVLFSGKDSVKRLRLFIAFARDCERERKIIHETCRADKTIKTLCRKLDVSLGCVDFSDVPSDAGRPQFLINSAVDKWKPDWFIFIFWGRLGHDAGLGMTGMEEEWNRAINLNKQGGGYPRVSLYFNEEEGNPYEADSFQEEALKGTSKNPLTFQCTQQTCGMSGDDDVVEVGMKTL